MCIRIFFLKKNLLSYNNKNRLLFCALKLTFTQIRWFLFLLQFFFLRNVWSRESIILQKAKIRYELLKRYNLGVILLSNKFRTNPSAGHSVSFHIAVCSLIHSVSTIIIEINFNFEATQWHKLKHEKIFDYYFCCLCISFQSTGYDFL